MSKTISFVAREELAEWLESQASAEMKTVSAVCQEIVAREYRRQRDDEPADGDSEQNEADESASDSPENGDSPTQTGYKELLEEYSDKWYHPDGAHRFAVEQPDDEFSSAGPRYFKSERGAADAIMRWWADS